MQQIAKLWVKAQPSVSVFIRASVRDHHAAEDVLQEVAGSVITSFDKYDADRPFGAWVTGIARNCILRYYRSTSRDRLLFDDELLDLMCDTFSHVSDESDLYEISLKQCLAKLTGRGRKVIDLRYSDGLNSDEIAGQLGMTPVAVRVLLHRVRKALRVCIDKGVATLRSGGPIKAQGERS